MSLDRAVGNLRLFFLLSEFSDRRRDQTLWTPDEFLFFRFVGSEVLFYEKGDFTKVAAKYSQARLIACSVVFNARNECYYVATFVKGEKAGPGMAKIFAYPRFENAIAVQSMFKVDSVAFKFNPKGKTILEAY